MPPGLLDGLTRIDDLLARIVEQNERLIGLAQGEEDRSLKIIFYTYPADGTYITLSSGTLILDFGAGTINTSGAVTQMKHSLQSDSKDFLRSIFVDANKGIVVQLDGQDKTPVKEGKQLLATYQQFTKATITATEDTEVFVLCCTNPEAIIQLMDTPSLISGAPKMVYGSVVDTDGTGDYFETDQAIGTTPTKYIQLYPTDTTKFKLNSARYYFEASNDVSFELWLLEDTNADDVQSLSDVVYNSGSGIARNTQKISLNSVDLPIDVKLGTSGKLYYMLDWSGAPGNTPGYLVVRGEKLA